MKNNFNYLIDCFGSKIIKEIKYSESNYRKTKGELKKPIYFGKYGYEYLVKIKYSITENHPDIDCLLPEYDKNNLDFEDVYYFQGDFNNVEQDILTMIEDILLVAGGGSNYKEVRNAVITIEKINEIRGIFEEVLV